MTESERDAYILGTERAELHRLGLQHQVWAEETRRGWDRAGFTAGQTILDLGCGPGFCTRELAYIVGTNGRVIGVDQSVGFIEFAREVNRLHGLTSEFQAVSFDGMRLEAVFLDGVYCRWALAWVNNPQAIIEKIVAALKPGGVFVAHEYYDWKILSTEPSRPALAAAIAAAFGSFSVSDGDINIGRRLPGLFAEAGLEVVEVRPMCKLALPGTVTWQWPTTFFDNYFPKLVGAGLLDQSTATQALEDWRQLERTVGASCQCPQMIEVIARKPRSPQ